MNPFASVLLSLQLATANPAPFAPSGDRWFAEDKMKHALTSMAVVGFAHSGARMVKLHGDGAIIAAVAGAAAAGIWKEFHDRSIGKPFSFRDLAWDAIGTGLGALLVSHAR